VDKTGTSCVRLERRAGDMPTKPPIISPSPRSTPFMESRVSTARCSTKTRTAITPPIPQEIIDEILGHLATDPAYSAVPSLRSCSLVSKSWISPCRRHLFYTATFYASNDLDGWLKAFPVPEGSPAHHVRDLCVWIGGDDCVSEEEFLKYTLWFTNAEKLTLLGHGIFSPLRVPSSWRLPQSVTSLTIKTNVFTLVDIRDIMAKLPNLDNLLLSGRLAVGKVSLELGRGLRGRFGGQLQLVDGPADEGAMDMLLEIPTGLRFTNIQIYCSNEPLSSTVKLAEACGNTLVKLFYSTPVYGSSRSFRFSRFSCLH